MFQFLLQQKKKQEEERNALRKEVVALRIMQANYEQIVKAHQNQPGQAEMRVSDETKFQVVSGTCTHLMQELDGFIIMHVPHNLQHCKLCKFNCHL